MRMIRHALIRIVRIGGASLAVAAWLLCTAVILALFTIGMACILVRLAFNAPMIAWRAGTGKDTSRP